MNDRIIADVPALKNSGFGDIRVGQLSTNRGLDVSENSVETGQVSPSQCNQIREIRIAARRQAAAKKAQAMRTQKQPVGVR